MSDLVDQVVGKVLGRTGAGAEHVIWTEWSQVAGERWKSSTPVKLDGSVLLVAVPDAAAATRLRYSTGNLLARIAARVGEGRVSAIRVKVRREQPGR